MARTPRAGQAAHPQHQLLVLSLKTLLLISLERWWRRCTYPAVKLHQWKGSGSQCGARGAVTPSPSLPTPARGTQRGGSRLSHRAASCYEAPSLTHHYFTPDKWFIGLSPPAPPLITALVRNPAALSMPLRRQHERWKMIQQHLRAGGGRRELESVRCRTLPGPASRGGYGRLTRPGQGLPRCPPVLTGGMRAAGAVPTSSTAAGRARGRQLQHALQGISCQRASPRATDPGHRSGMTLPTPPGHRAGRLTCFH